jgi:predicted nucleotidyltransferase
VSEKSFSPQEIFAALHRHGVDYVAIGGIAANAHGSRRLTLDVDIIPAPEEPNDERLAAALDELPTGVDDVNALNGAPGAAPYEDLRERAIEVEVRGTPVRIASLDDLIAMKRATGRHRTSAISPN